MFLLNILFGNVFLKYLENNFFQLNKNDGQITLSSIKKLPNNNH